MRYVFSLAFLVVGTSPVLAHRLIVEPTVVGDQVKVEAYYEDDTPAQNAKVVIWLGEQKVAEGRTNDKGVWTCPKPAPGTYLVRVEDVGHSGKETLVIADPTATPPSMVAGPEPIVEKSNRDDKTGPQWGRLAIGLAGIAILAGLWKWQSRRSGRSTAPDNTTPP